MEVIVNNNVVETGDNISVSEFIEKQLQRKDGIAIAVNETIIPKGNWAITHLKEKDNILIITATAGG
ncbi:MAG: sulfur carrier protein ThiS [Chitinophagales bacterium]|nr:sulfur carrier protein ThiS [Chitinophagales bacterium]